MQIIDNQECACVVFGGRARYVRYTMGALRKLQAERGKSLAALMASEDIEDAIAFCWAGLVWREAISFADFLSEVDAVSWSDFAGFKVECVAAFKAQARGAGGDSDPNQQTATVS